MLRETYAKLFANLLHQGLQNSGLLKVYHFVGEALGRQPHVQRKIYRFVFGFTILKSLPRSNTVNQWLAMRRVASQFAIL